MADHTSSDRPPLWRTMLAAYSNRWLDVELTSTGNAEGLAYAAEIRAIADELVMRFDPWLAEHAAVAEWLRNEADRAERGEP